MKIALVVLVGLLALAASSTVGEHGSADPNYAERQSNILQILDNINQPSYYENFVKIGESYNITQNIDKYTNQTAVQQFLQYYNYGMLPRDRIFSVFYVDQLRQAIALFNVLYYARDYETFFNTAVFARQNLNQGLFLYAFTVAVVHRPDTSNIVLPPIYEVYPYYFVNSEAIQQAYAYKQGLEPASGVSGSSGYNGYTINYNYSGYYLNLNEEQTALSYYLEDVGINSYYYYYNIYYPFWMSSQQYGFQNINRGEQYYFFYQQLIARYYLERLSNGLGQIPYLDFNEPLETPYYPSLEYPNGLDFPSRPAYANLHEYFYNYGQRWTTSSVYGYSRSFVTDYEERINAAIDSGVVYNSEGQMIKLYSEEGLNILGNLVQGNSDSPNYRYYGAIWYFASHLLGYSYQPLSNYQIAPSALEQFETALRDPVFYQLYGRVILKFQRYIYNLPSYSQTDLFFPGVEISKFQVDRLVTYEDEFYVDISNAVYYSKQELKNNQSSFNVRVRQSRLNSRPFTYRVNVQSNEERQAVVKVFLGPANDEFGRSLNISQNRLNFVLLDYFVYNLKSGENIISRNSLDSTLYGADPISYADLYRQGSSGKPDKDAYSYFFYPRRYMLPRGSAGGTPYQFYVVIYPYVPRQGQYGQQSTQQPGNQHYYSYFYPFVKGSKQQFIDNYSLGYPFDRFIQYEGLFYDMPNGYFYETNVYHKENINAVQSD